MTLTGLLTIGHFVVLLSGDNKRDFSGIDSSGAVQATFDMGMLERHLHILGTYDCLHVPVL